MTTGAGADKVFAGSIPKFYETYLVPLLFEPYAADLATAARGEIARPRARSGRRHRRRDAGAGGRAARARLDRGHGPESADARSGGGSRNPAAGGVASGGRHAAALPRRRVRRGGVPVRGHVLPRQGQGVLGGAPCAPSRGRAGLQRLGSDRGERVRGRRDRRARAAVSRGSAPVPGAHTARLSRAGAGSRRIWPAAASWRRPRSSPWPRGAGHGRRGIPRSPTARAHRCGARSRRATPRGSRKRPRSPRTRSAGGSVGATWTARCRRTWSPSSADGATPGLDAVSSMVDSVSIMEDVGSPT